MERWSGRVAVVTGASAGIGAAVAYQLQDAGLTVVGLARRVEKIPVAVAAARKEAEERGRVPMGRAPRPGKLLARQCDLSNEEDILAAFQWIRNNIGTIDILVNNAGVPGEAKLTDNNTREWRRIIDVNLLALSICTREGIKLMREKNVEDGHIVHIGSRLGHGVYDLPGVHFYSAIKHGVRVLTEGLRKELVAAKSRIRITEVSPGFVKTEIIDTLESAAHLSASVGSDKPEDFWTIPHLNSEDVADAVLYALSTPSHVQIHEIIMGEIGETI